MPNPTPQEEFLLQYCNYPVQQGGYDGFGFFWDEWGKVTPDYWTRNIMIDDWLEHSYFGYSDSYGFVALQYFETGRVAYECNNWVWATTDILRGDITTIDETHFKVEVNNINYIQNVYWEYITTNPSQQNYFDRFSISSRNGNPYYNGSRPNNTPPTSFEYTAPSRESALQELVTVFHNIEIYVDGEKWTDARAITYTWQSVPSISGKNGISFLSTIQSVYLNNGDPVNNAPANYIQFADDSNVAILVGEQVDDPTLVTIQYIVPTGTYEYIKLVYKVDSAPTSITDGTAVDILQANRSVTISGIANGNTYFFKIFTDVSESEPYEFTTTKPPIASNYVFELDLSTDGKDIVRYDATKDIGNHKQGELYGSGISIEDGILTTSSWIYWDYDGTENPKFIPANCTLTFEYDTFFPNGEGYLDWYIIDSSGTQQIYWCFDTQHAFQSNKWYNCKTVAKVQNGKIVRYKYVLDGNEVSSNTADINMPCVNTETSLGISQIYFRLTRTTKFKNMSIYFDFSEYHDGGGSGSGSSGRA